MRGTALLAAALTIGVVVTPAMAARRVPVPVSVTVSPGHMDEVVQALGGSALRVVRRDGRDLQVVAARARVPLLRSLPGVAAAFVAPSSYADADPEDPGAAVGRSAKGQPVISEGLERVGADALKSLANDGKGVTIAILDLGFGGTRMPALQAAGELPTKARLETQSFDSVNGLAGRNAYGNLTNHGELVAQTVFDYAPKASYIFVNYHTEQDFQAAVNWLIQRNPDVVVHSNSFIEGPFDGTGDAAEAVDRASASGIAWVNSAGNYAEKHWRGPWADAAGGGVLDWPQPNWTFTAGANTPITFALSWNQDPGAELTDLDMAVDHRNDDGSWAEVASSRDSQATGARPAERITSYLSPTDGTFRLRVVLAAGPPPGGELTLFSREVTLDVLGDPGVGSVPTPGDAESAITVGAVDWSNNALKSYSSRGPTTDGRMKPDIVAPTNTRVRVATGPKSVGGTSNAAPNVAGALALLIGARRAAGTPLDPATAKDVLMGDALDLGDLGSDMSFGAGRLRMDVDPPTITVSATSRAAMRARFAKLPLHVRATVTDASRLMQWAVMVDGREVVRRGGEKSPSATIGRSRLPDGPHVIEVRATDWVGNVGIRRIAVSVDARAPRVGPLRVERPRASDAGAGRSAHAVLDIRDYGVVRVDLTLASRARRIHRVVRVGATGPVTIAVGAVVPGRYQATLRVVDRAGNTTYRRSIVRVRR